MLVRVADIYILHRDAAAAAVMLTAKMMVLEKTSRKRHVGFNFVAGYMVT